jgi:hypothetical protein
MASARAHPSPQTLAQVRIHRHASATPCGIERARHTHTFFRSTGAWGVPALISGSPRPAGHARRASAVPAAPARRRAEAGAAAAAAAPPGCAGGCPRARAGVPELFDARTAPNAA